jgi:hypothetical protein
VRAIAAAIALAGAAAPAGAAPDDLVSRPLVLDAGDIAATLVTEVVVAPSGELAVVPDVWVGATPRVTIGVIRSNASLDRVAAGGDPCCGIDVRWRWLAGELAIAPRARAVVRSVDPWHPAATLGALVRWTRGRFAIASDPYVRVGLADRAANRDVLVLPVWLEVQPAARWLVAIHTGWGGDLSTMAAWHVPLALDVRTRITAHVDVAVEIGFTSFVAPRGAMEQQVATLAVTWSGS